MPKIAIITVCFNAEKQIANTIESVLNQTFKNYEYLVIDGASRDNTLAIISSYKSKINKLISEPDEGLYYAMNKALKIATGDYVLFMNAGDTFHDKHTLEKLFWHCTNADLIYGDTLILNEKGHIVRKRRLRPPEKLKFIDFSKGMLVSHQAFIAKRSLVPLFNVNYRFSADFDWCVSILKNTNTICNAKLIIAHFLEGGQTSKTIIPGLKERFRIMYKHYGFCRTLLSHFFIVFRFILRR